MPRDHDDYDDRDDYTPPRPKIRPMYGLYNGSGLRHCWNCEGYGCEECRGTGYPE